MPQEVMRIVVPQSRGNGRELMGPPLEVAAATSPGNMRG